MRILLVFIDGFGLGVADPRINPIINSKFTVINKLLMEQYCIATDAQLGVHGLPQSATGQTAILTGLNAPKVVGRHINAYPTPTLRSLIEQHSILKRIKDLGFNVANANMYTNEYLERIYSNDRRAKLSATTLATLAAGIPFKRIEDMLFEKAVYQDLTNEILLKRGYNVPLRTPSLSGEILASLTRIHDFVLFEYFQTDLAGHSQDRSRCDKVLSDLNIMFESLLSNIDFETTLLILASDHGNIEDIGVPTHTTNKVPTVLKGRNASQIAARIKSIDNIASAIEDLFRLSLCYL